MQKYTKLEIEIINLKEVDVISTSFTEETDSSETLITKGGMARNINSENVGLFR